MSRDRRPINYGADMPPTREDRDARIVKDLQDEAAKAQQLARQLADAHAELDRLDVPRGVLPGHPDRFRHVGALTLAQRIRFATCGSTEPDAQPRLLQEWTPEVWRGERLFDRAA